MKNKLFIIFAIHILQGAEENRLPQLSLSQSLKQISKKDSISAILLGASLAFLTYNKVLPQHKSLLKKALSLTPSILPLAITIGTYGYLGKTKNKNTFSQTYFWKEAKKNIFLQRLSELAQKDPEKAYDIYMKKHWEVNKQILKNHTFLIEKFTSIEKKRKEEAIEAKNKAYEKNFLSLVDSLRLYEEHEKALQSIFSQFTSETPNEAFGKILGEKIREIDFDPTDAINNYQEKDKNIYFICFVKFAFIEFTKETAMEEIKKIINDTTTNWTDNIDKELGRGIKAFMEKTNITDEEVKELINNSTLQEKRRGFVSSIFSEKVKK